MIKSVFLSSIRLLSVLFISVGGVCVAQIIPGSLDTSFSGGTMANLAINSIAVQSDGKVVIGGEFTSYNGLPAHRLARINTDGSLDTSFSSGTVQNNTINSLILQPDGKILIGGTFTDYNFFPSNRLARINSDGSMDIPFSGGTMANGDINAIALQPDGKILIAGAFTTYNGISRNRLARINSDGSLDTSFSGGTMANSIIYSIALQPDGKILIGGLFTTYNGVSRNRLARINSDGSLDTSFSGGTMANNIIRSIALQPDGRILIGGTFTSYNGTSRNRLARINSDGSLDIPFSGGSMANNTVISIVIQPDDKILIGGLFITYNGISQSYIARINSDGSLDNSFSSGVLANNVVNSIVMQPDGKILIGGAFSTYKGTSRSRLARIHSIAVECLGGIGTITFSSFGFCLQSAGQAAQVSLLDLVSNSPIAGRIINGSNLFKPIKAPYRVAPTAGSSTQGPIRYLGVPVVVPALSTEQTGDMYITSFKPLEIGTGGNIIPQYQ